MNSRRLKDDTSRYEKDIRVLVRKTDVLAKSTGNALDSLLTLDEMKSKELSSANKRIGWLSLAVVVQALYLIIML